MLIPILLKKSHPGRLTSLSTANVPSPYGAVWGERWWCWWTVFQLQFWTFWVLPHTVLQRLRGQQNRAGGFPEWHLASCERPQPPGLMQAEWLWASTLPPPFRPTPAGLSIHPHGSQPLRGHRDRVGRSEAGSKRYQQHPTPCIQSSFSFVSKHAFIIHFLLWASWSPL